MAISSRQIRDGYPLPVYNYRVSIGGESVSFSKVSGLKVEFEPITYRHGLSWQEGAEHLPGMKQPLRITLTKGLVRKGDFLFNWISTVRQTKVEKRMVFIDLCDEEGFPVISWRIINAFPVKLEAPGFDAAANDVAIETLELMADDMEITYH